MSFESNESSDNQQFENTAEHSFDILSVLKFIASVAVAVAVVLYALIWMKQYNERMSTRVVDDTQEEINSERDGEERPLSIEERQAQYESLVIDEESGSADQTILNSDERKEIFDTLHYEEENINDEQEMSFEDRQKALDSLKY